MLYQHFDIVKILKGKSMFMDGLVMQISGFDQRIGILTESMCQTNVFRITTSI